MLYQSPESRGALHVHSSMLDIHLLDIHQVTQRHTATLSSINELIHFVLGLEIIFYKLLLIRKELNTQVSER